MYGLRDSPKKWENTRDSFLSSCTWTVKSSLFWMKQSDVHPSLWYVVKEEGPVKPKGPREALSEDQVSPDNLINDHEIIGGMLVHVDDLLLALDRS
eukprot:5322769-Amphidinium_carterae.1